MSKSKITVTLDSELIATLDREATQKNIKWSHLVEEAVRLWQKSGLEREMIAGYLAMAEEDQHLSEANLAASFDSLSP